MRRIGLTFAAGLLATVFAAGNAQAQMAPDKDCDGLLYLYPMYSMGDEITGCTKSQDNLRSVLNFNQTISNVVVGRLRPADVAPAGLTLDAAEALSRLTGSQEIAIVPTADMVEAAPELPSWNFWVDGKYNWLNDTSNVSDLDGHLVNLIVGADYKVNDRLVLGLLASHESSNREDDVAPFPFMETDAWGGGAYFGLTLTPNWILSGNAALSDINTESGGFVVSEFDSLRVQAAAALTGYYYAGTWRISPSLGLAWSEEWQEDKAGFLPDETFLTGALSPGIQIGNTVALSDTVTVEPWGGAQLDWNFLNKVKQDGVGTILDDPNVDLRLQGGLNFSFGPRTQLALTGEVSGLLLDNITTYTAGAQFAFQF
jgi:hypothetical protein